VGPPARSQTHNPRASKSPQVSHWSQVRSLRVTIQSGIDACSRALLRVGTLSDAWTVGHSSSLFIDCVQVLTLFYLDMSYQRDLHFHSGVSSGEGRL
jgi:hypothetical protein